MKIKKDEKGAIIIEACVVIPLLLVVMMLLVFLINIFIVQSLVQYGLNQTVNELGNYTYYLNYLGIIDWSNNVNEDLNKKNEQNRKDYEKAEKAYNSVTNAITDSNAAFGSIQDAAGENIDYKKLITGIETAADSTETAVGDVRDVWNMVKDYAKDPSQLITRLKSQLLQESKDLFHKFLGAFLGKIMMNRYVSDDLMQACGVVSTNYNGKKEKGTYMTGIGGMDFSHSSFLGGDDSRQIDLVVYYRIRFPFNLSGWLGIDEGPLYDNSLLVVQRASGYGWINGDGKGKGKDVYNKSE